jgi:hypothetical protein
LIKSAAFSAINFVRIVLWWVRFTAHPANDDCELLRVPRKRGLDM